MPHRLTTHDTTRLSAHFAMIDGFVKLYANFVFRYSINHAQAARALACDYKRLWTYRTGNATPRAPVYKLLRVYLDIDDDAYIAAQCELGQGTPTLRLPRKPRKAKPRKQPAPSTGAQA